VLRGWIQSEQLRTSASTTNRQYVLDHAGATAKIMAALPLESN